MEGLLKAFIVAVLKELRVPFYDPCDPTYLGECCLTEVEKGVCLEGTYCSADQPSLIDLIFGNTPAGLLLGGTVEIYASISYFGGEPGGTTSIGAFTLNQVELISFYDKIDLTGLSVPVNIEWSYFFHYIKDGQTTVIPGNSCSFDVIDNVNSGLAGSIKACR